MAKCSSTLLMALLMTSMAWASVSWHGAAQMVAAPGRPAGCHQHGSTVPASQPVSYRCCQSGHDAAILQVSIAIQLDSPAVVPLRDPSPAPMMTSAYNCLRNLTISSADPPDTVPLRV